MCVYISVLQTNVNDSEGENYRLSHSHLCILNSTAQSVCRVFCDAVPILFGTRTGFCGR